MTAWPRVVLLGCLIFAGAAGAAQQAQTVVPTEARASADFNAQAATAAWLATVPPADRMKSDGYFEGGYWLMLWDFLYSAAIMILLLESRVSVRMRDLARRWTRNKWLEAFLYWIQFMLLVTMLQLPLTVYEGFFREHQYGLSNQSFAAWVKDGAIGLALGLILGGVVVATLFAIVRRLPRSWHIWGAVVAILFSMVAVVIAPVFIMPLFNKYTPMKEGELKREILSLARANGIPAKDVYEVDASRQSKRVSANVSGLFGTDRITLNDNLLARCSAQGVLSVMGHEMGHYVMHHLLNGMLFTAVFLVILFSLLRWGLRHALAWRGSRWSVSTIDDVAVLPLAVLLVSAIGFVTTPIENTYTRTQEYEADIFGLNAARQPDAEAQVDLLLGEYRKLNPTALEEFLFFDHPSGRTRIYAAMRWKAENLCLFDASLPCANRPAGIGQ